MDRNEALRNLSNIEGEDLCQLAQVYDIPIFKENGKKNKGWAGQVIERHLNLPINSLQEPNAGSWELKLISLKFLKDMKLTFKETMQVTMIKAENIINTEFEDSHLLSKLRRLVVGARIWESIQEQKSIFHSVKIFDLDDPSIYNQVKEDYYLVKDTILTQGFSSLTGKMGVYIQPRTKGRGHGSITRAFYARKCFLKLIFPDIYLRGVHN